MEWRPIAEYDAMKKKPALAAFYFQAETGRSHPSNNLREIVQFTRHYGSRICTKFIVLPTP